MRRLLLVLLPALILFAAGATVAWALGELVQKPSPNGCITANGNSGQCLDGEPQTSIDHILVSPDGKHAYARQQVQLVTYDRNPTTGVLTQKACLNGFGGNGCAADEHVKDLGEALLTPDGEMLYVAANSNNSVTAYDRDPSTGLLTFLSCVAETNAFGCSDVRGLSNATHLALSPDAKNLYVGSGNSNTLAIFNRDTTTGALTQHADTRGCISETGAGTCQNGTGLDIVGSLKVTQDGKHVYATGMNSDAVAWFTRDTTTGELTQGGCIAGGGAGGCVSAAGLESPGNTLELSPDNKNVYVTSWGLGGATINGYAILDRDATTGALSQRAAPDGCISDTGSSGQCKDGRALVIPADLVFSPDGTVLYGTGYSSGSILIFDRDATGGLTQRADGGGCISNSGAEGCTSGVALANPDALAISPDGKHLYSGHLSSLAIFDRDATTTPTQTQTQTQTGTTPATTTPTTPTATPTTTPVVIPRPPTPTPVATPAPKASQFVSLPSARTCVSRRRLRVTLKVPRGQRVRGAKVLVNGRSKATRTSSRFTVPVNLTGLPKGTFTVAVEVTLADGKKLTQRRRFRTCAAKRRRG